LPKQIEALPRSVASSASTPPTSTEEDTEISATLTRTFVVAQKPLLTQGYLWVAEVVAVAAVAFMLFGRAL
jgi:hypothetical protein